MLAHLSREDKYILLAAGVVLLFGPQIAAALTRQAAKAAGGVIIDGATGAVIGAGEAVGIPPTSMDKCTQDIAAGDSWNASFDCPAGTFLKYLVGKATS